MVVVELKRETAGEQSPASAAQQKPYHSLYLSHCRRRELSYIPAAVYLDRRTMWGAMTSTLVMTEQRHSERLALVCDRSDAIKQGFQQEETGLLRRVVWTPSRRGEGWPSNPVPGHPQGLLYSFFPYDYFDDLRGEVKAAVEEGFDIPRGWAKSAASTTGMERERKAAAAAIVAPYSDSSPVFALDPIYLDPETGKWIRRMDAIERVIAPDGVTEAVSDPETIDTKLWARYRLFWASDEALPLLTDLPRWRAFCEWIHSLPGKTADFDEVSDHDVKKSTDWRQLLTAWLEDYPVPPPPKMTKEYRLARGNWQKAAAIPIHEARWAIDLVYHSEGGAPFGGYKGWHLSSGWKTRLKALELIAKVRGVAAA